ncbi:MAG TPA: ribokinase [Acidimicrobiales bacterium]|nr:ribokinase [Acidimicrobiales bacterium]
MGESRRPRLGVVGSCNVDLVIRTTSLPRPGETVLGGDVERLPGGKGANQAAAAAILGGDVTLIASVGDDAAGEWLVGSLTDRGVDTSLVRRSRRPTGTAFITVAADGENEIVVSPGANDDLDPSDSRLDLFDVVVAQLEVAPTVVAEAARRARRFILNASPVAGLDDTLLNASDVVIANGVEAASFDVDRLAHCVVTLGAEGAVHLSLGREVARARPPRVTPIDTVGAGDVFIAAYALRDAEGAEPADALRFAVVAGALATQARGAQGALPTREEVESWM